jgi:hypothetical protein
VVQDVLEAVPDSGGGGYGFGGLGEVIRVGSEVLDWVGFDVRGGRT